MSSARDCFVCGRAQSGRGEGACACGVWRCECGASLAWSHTIEGGRPVRRLVGGATRHGPGLAADCPVLASDASRAGAAASEAAGMGCCGVVGACVGCGARLCECGAAWNTEAGLVASGHGGGCRLPEIAAGVCPANGGRDCVVGCPCGARVCAKYGGAWRAHGAGYVRGHYPGCDPASRPGSEH